MPSDCAKRKTLKNNSGLHHVIVLVDLVHLKSTQQKGNHQENWTHHSICTDGPGWCTKRVRKFSCSFDSFSVAMGGDELFVQEWDSWHQDVSKVFEICRFLCLRKPRIESELEHQRTSRRRRGCRKKYVFACRKLLKKITNWFPFSPRFWPNKSGNWFLDSSIVVDEIMPNPYPFQSTKRHRWNKTALVIPPGPKWCHPREFELQQPWHWNIWFLPENLT